MGGLEGILYEISAIFVGAAVFASLFLFTKQPMILAYIALGAVAGPAGFGLISEPEHIRQMSNVGVILLLFLVGLDLQPQKLMGLFRESALLTLGTGIAFCLVSSLFALAVGLGVRDAAIFGIAMMFSSTVVGLKLVPTTTLHQRRAGELMTSVLLLQDMFAILAILFITGKGGENVAALFGVLLVKFVLFAAGAFAAVRYVVFRLLERFDEIQEYMFVLTLGWCMLCAQTAHALGLSHEMGAFVGGLTLASHRVALVIAVHLKPLREFFLILFFFAVGAALDFGAAPRLLIAGVLFGGALVFLKSYTFRYAFKAAGESKPLSQQLGARLGQASEFSFLVAFAAASAGALTHQGELLIQVTTIVTFVLSTYWVVRYYPTPISADADLRKD
jgi:Kef-type K+ transport system membrane component KefB